MPANEGIRVHKAEHCTLCGAAGELLYDGMRDCHWFAPGVWDFRECRRCGLLRLGHRPLVEEIGNLYASYLTHSAGAAGLRGVGRAKASRETQRRAIVAAALGYRPQGIGCCAGWPAKPWRESRSCASGQTCRRSLSTVARSLRACAERSGFRVELLQTSARNAGAMWVASKADGGDAGSSHVRRPPGVLLQLQGLALQLSEETLCVCGRAVGEEIVLVAVKE